MTAFETVAEWLADLERRVTTLEQQQRPRPPMPAPTVEESIALGESVTCDTTPGKVHPHVPACVRPIRAIRPTP